MSAVRYRTAGPGDAEALAALGRRTFTETFGHLYLPEDLEMFLLKHSEAKWREELCSPDVAVRLAHAEGEACAYAQLAPPSLPLTIERPAIELRRFYVLKPWHGQGVAQELMRWVLEEARERHAEDLFLSVFSENHRARRFYESYGFRYIRTYAFMVGAQADEEHILGLRLKERA